jgi:hypothetical protein
LSVESMTTPPIFPAPFCDTWERAVWTKVNTIRSDRKILTFRLF